MNGTAVPNHGFKMAESRRKRFSLRQGVFISACFLIGFLAIATKLIFPSSSHVFKNPWLSTADFLCNVTNAVARNAINRTTTDTCFFQLKKFACDLDAEKVYPKSLPNLCLPDVVFTSDLEMRSADSIKIVYIMTVRGRDDRQISRLLQAIYRPRHFYLIHVDARDDYLFGQLGLLGKKFPNIKVLEKRHSPIWGGASLLPTILDAIKVALKMDQLKWDYIINVSESDLPVKTDEALTEYLAANYGKNFVKSHGKSLDQFMKSQGLKFSFYECDHHLYKIGNRTLPEGIQFDGGSDWVVLHHSFCQYVASDKPDQLVAGLLTVFNFTLLPAESFFHTVLKNSVFCQSVIDGNLRFTNWIRSKGCNCQHKNIVDWCGCSPHILRLKDQERLEALTSKPIYFARKFDPIIDMDIMNSILGQVSAIPPINHHFLNIYSRQEKTVPSPFLELLSSLTHLSKMGTDSEIVNLYFSVDLEGSRSVLVVEQEIVTETGEVVIIQAQLLFNNSFHIIANTTGTPADRLLNLQVGTEFDEKEKVFRNYAGALGPHSDPLLRISALDGEPAVTQVIWLDPAGVVAGSFEVNISARANDDFAHAPVFAKPLRPGIWHVFLMSQWKTIAQTRFLILPSFNDPETSSGPPLNQYLSHDFSMIYKFLSIDAQKLSAAASEVSSKNAEQLIEWVDQMVSQFYSLDDFCYVQPGEFSCYQKQWSSFFSDFL